MALQGEDIQPLFTTPDEVFQLGFLVSTFFINKMSNLRVLAEKPKAIYTIDDITKQFIVVYPDNQVCQHIKIIDSNGKISVLVNQ